MGLVVGSVLGSFIEATAGRVINNRSVWGRSYCLRCQSKIRWYDLFPILSFLFLRGRCRDCHKKIPPETLIVEIATAFLVATLFYLYFPNIDRLLNKDYYAVFGLLDLLFKLFVLVILEIVFITDFKVGLIFDKITYPASLIAFVYLFISSVVKSALFYQQLQTSPLGTYLLPPVSGFFYTQLERLWLPLGWSIIMALILSGFFALLIVITKGRGMGWGDVKYAFFLGLALGFPYGIEAIFLAFFAGAVISLLLVAFSKKRFGQTIPFGPFLSLGALLSLFWGQKILDLYFKLGVISR